MFKTLNKSVQEFMRVYVADAGTLSRLAAVER
jgi:hypothetical protein